jgi:hypothetical protein
MGHNDAVPFTAGDLGSQEFASLAGQFFFGGDESAPEGSSSAGNGGLARWILYGILYLLFVEQLLAWDFHTGLWLLCPLVPPLLWLVRRS